MHYVPFTIDQDGPEECLVNIATWNVRGMASTTKAWSLRHSLTRHGVDLCMFQEINWTTEHCDDMKKPFPELVAATSPSQSGGTLIASPKGLTGILVQRHCTASGRISIATIKMNAVEALLINVYCPADSSRNRLDFLDHLEAIMDAEVTGHLPVIMAGDWNFVPNPTLDRTGSRSADACASKMNDLCSKFDLVDAWRAKYPTAPGHTYYHQANQGQSSARLDRIYLSSSLVPRIRTIMTLPLMHSDHRPLLLSLAGTFPIGRPRWCLNSSILDDPAVAAEARSIISDLQAQLSIDGTDQLASWLRHKKRITQLLRTRSVLRARQDRAEEQADRAHLADVNRLIALNGTSPDLVSQFADALSLVDAHDRRIAEGAKIASKARRDLEDELPTRYFFNRARSHTEAKKIQFLATDSGDITANSRTIRNQFHQYYQTLFSRLDLESSAKARLLDTYRDRHLSEESRRHMEGPTTTAEVEAILSSLPNHKSPGPDGLTYEFYKTFKAELSPLLSSLWNFLTTKATPQVLNRETFTPALICLLPKAGDLSLCKNWRPISLLNADYKIMMALFAARLSPHLGQVIGEEQTGFLPGRSIFNAILGVKAAFGASAFQDHGFALLLDLEKAYDRVDHDFLFAIAERIGLPGGWITCLKGLYSSAKSTVLINNIPTDSIQLERGVRQGCPLSPLLFLLVIEALANLIRDDARLKGITLSRNVAIKIVLYADDTTLLLSNPEELAVAEELLSVFEQGSGAKINRTKSELMSLCPVDQVQPVHSGFVLRSVTHTSRLLGATIGPLFKDSAGWTNVLSRISAVLAPWRHQGLSLQGKILVWRSLGLSQVTFLAHCQWLPRSVAAKMERIMALFIWNTKRQEYAKRLFLHIPPEEGGLGLPRLCDWQSALCRKVLVKLSRMDTFWGKLLGPCLKKSWPIFRCISRTSHLEPAPRPSMILEQLGPHLDSHYWAGHLTHLQSSTGSIPVHLATEVLPLVKSPHTPRKVRDLKWRLLLDCAVLRHPPSACPHCNSPDSTRHRFWDCRLAVRRREELSQIAPECLLWEPQQFLLGTTDQGVDMVLAEAYIWSLHMEALWVKGILSHRPIPMLDLVAEWQ